MVDKGIRYEDALREFDRRFIVEVVEKSDGNLCKAADTLGVHRNTVAYRVRRIERLTGWRLSDPELRLPLAIALRLVQT